MTTRSRFLSLLLGLSILFNVILFREIIAYESRFSRQRFSNRLKQRGLLDRKVPLITAFGDSTMVILALGQSNAGNYSDTYYSPKHDVYNYFEGRLYAATDPLIGSDGNGGSVWTVLADLILKRNLYKRVVLVSLGVGGSTADCWVDGDCRAKLDHTLAVMERDGLIATHVLWQQGESDGGITPSVYTNHLVRLLELLRSHKQPAPFFCAITSYSPNNKTETGIDSGVVFGQQNFIANEKNVYRGAYTDSLIGAIDRYDGQHFSETGKLKCAQQWLTAITNPHR